MPNAPVGLEAKAQIKAAVSLILAPQPRKRQAFSAKSHQVSKERSPHLSLQERSPQPKAYQLNLLTLQELPQEPALYIEAIPANLALGREQRFWLTHQPTGLRVPGQFSRQEAEYILSATQGWNWEVDLKTREPACRYHLLWLLEGICKKPQVREVAA